MGETLIESPCTGVCVIHDATGWCRGCGRTIDEIAGWAEASPEARRSVIAELPARIDQLQL